MTRRWLLGLIPAPFLATPAPSEARPGPRYMRFADGRIVDLTKIDFFRVWDSDYGNLRGPRRHVCLWVSGETFTAYGPPGGKVDKIRDAILDHFRRHGLVDPTA